MKKLIKYLNAYKKESIIGPLFKLIEACFELIVPLVMADIIDVGIKGHNMPYILRLGGILVLLGILGLSCSVTAQYFAAKASMGFGTALRKDLYAHINRFSHKEIDEAGTSTLITRMTSDINQAQTGVNLVLRLFLRSPFIVIGAVIMSFTINVKLTIIFLTAAPFIALVIYLVTAKTIPFYKNIQTKTDHVSLLTRESLIGARVIRAFTRQKLEEQQFDDSLDDLYRIQLRVGRISALLNPATYVIVNLAIAALLWFGGKSVYHGEILQGEVIALVNYMTQILLALVALANLIVIYSKGSASALRINEIFEIRPSIADDSDDGQFGRDVGVPPEAKRKQPESQDARILFQNVSFAYHETGDYALTDISFTVNKGETLGIIGGTGSGKSTLINLIPRFYEATKGSIFINGVSTTQYPLKVLREKAALVPQKAVLFKGTIRENIEWGKEAASEEEIFQALAIAQAKEFVDAKPEGLDTMIMQNGKNLSGGQRQRLTIARAVVREPEILILDDSSSALDYATDAKLRKALLQTQGDKTIILVSQRASALMHADRILVLEEGRIAGEGTHEELLKTCPLYEEICRSQMSGKECEARG